MNEDNAVGFILIAALIFWVAAPESEIKEKTVYFRFCPDLQHNSYSCPERLEVMEMAFKIFPKEQMVVSRGAMATRRDCSVFDEDNWQCREHGSTKSMWNGKYVESGDLETGSLDENGNQSFLPRYQQISGFEYYARSGIIFFRNFLGHGGHPRDVLAEKGGK